MLNKPARKKVSKDSGGGVRVDQALVTLTKGSFGYSSLKVPLPLCYTMNKFVIVRIFIE